MLELCERQTKGGGDRPGQQTDRRTEDAKYPEIFLAQRPIKS